MTTWIHSLGGPLVVAPKAAARLWNGSEPSTAAESDYTRARAIKGLIGLVELGNTRALILGGQPARTTFAADGALFIRQVAVDEGHDAVQAGLQLAGTTPWDEVLMWQVPGPVELFDAAYPYTEVKRVQQIDLAPAQYVVRAGYVETSFADLILVQVRPVRCEQ